MHWITPTAIVYAIASPIWWAQSQNGEPAMSTCAVAMAALSLSRASPVVPRERRSKMTWKTPKIVEVPVGMEINMYACAARK
jgi:coenzyme PQQ precursor peptide PqqA